MPKVLKQFDISKTLDRLLIITYMVTTTIHNPQEIVSKKALLEITSFRIVKVKELET